MKILRTDETIVAQASGKGRGIRGIARISGPLSLDALNNLFFADEVIFPDRPQIIPGRVLFGDEKIPVACDLYFWPEGHGFTRQMSVELHLPGNQPLIDWTIKTLCRNGCRPACAGEFTLRAFLAGRIDLSQAEAVLGVIDSKDEKELKLALTQLAGGLKLPLEHVHGQLLDLLSHLEAEFDFVDEDIEFIDRGVMKRTMRQILESIHKIQKQIEHRTDTSELPKVVLVGAPNAGKSSLFNSLSRMTALDSRFHCGAVVSESPGTTRDYLECECSWQSVCFKLIDTAGLEPNDSPAPEHLPEFQASLKTREARDTADLLLFCKPWNEDGNHFSIASAMHPSKPLLMVWTKADDVRDDEISGQPVTSVRSTHGLDHLLARIVTLLQRSQQAIEILPSTALRCREMLDAAHAALSNALSLDDDLLIASELRHAWEQIGMITGTTFHDELLDRIFSRFCIGK